MDASWGDDWAAADADAARTRAEREHVTDEGKLVLNKAGRQHDEGATSSADEEMDDEALEEHARLIENPFGSGRSSAAAAAPAIGARPQARPLR